MPKDPQKTDFIELDKNEFKKKGINLKYIFIIFISVLALFFGIYYGPSFSNFLKIFSIKEPEEIERPKGINDSEIILSKELELLKSRNEKALTKVEPLEEIKKNINSLDKKVELLSSKYNGISEDIKSLQNNVPILKSQKKSESGIENKLVLYTLIDNLESRIISGKEYLTELEEIKNNFSDNLMLAQAISEIEASEVLIKLNEINLLDNFDLNVGTNIDFSDILPSNKSQNFKINSIEDLKEYLTEILSGLIAIRKIDESKESDLEKNFINPVFIKKKLSIAKNYFIVGRLENSLREIKSINEPTPTKIKVLEQYLSELIKLQKVLRKLKNKILEDDTNN
tara:strand:- start:1307 stop:2329 length:1023 start_codon:yes stop_codon:yes gene_type:complete